MAETHCPFLDAQTPPWHQCRRGTWSTDCGGWGRKLQGEKEGKKAGRLEAADTQSLALHHLSGRVEMPWSLEAVCSFQPTACALSAQFSLEKQSQSSVCTVNTIKRKPLEMSKGKLDNLCLDAGIWSLKVKETGQTPEVCARPAPVRHISILPRCLCALSTEVGVPGFPQVSSDIADILWMKTNPGVRLRL